MTYVYDITLNFNNELYEFFEWQKDDLISHIKRIHLIKVESSDYNEILDYNVSFTNDFLLLIFNKCELYTNRNVETISYAFLLTDGYRVMALSLDSTGKVIKYSSLLLDDEEDILNLSNRLSIIKLDYAKISKKDEIDFKTRLEKRIVKYLKKDLKLAFEKKEVSKLKYLYYEYFNKELEDIDKIYYDLLKEMDGEVTKNIYKLYDVIKLSYSHKIV